MSAIVTVGFDRSESGYAAVRWAAAEAERRRATLRVVHCYHMPIVSDLPSAWLPPSAREARRADDDEELVALRRTLHDLHPSLPLRIDLVPGAAWIALTDDDHPSDMTVVGASAHRGAAAAWLGSTARGVVRHAACPVIVARGNATIADRIVVGVDGSPAADAALDWAVDEANLHQAPLKVIHVWDYPYARIGDLDSESRDLTQVDAACLLDTAVGRARERCTAAVEAELLEGSPAYFLPATTDEGDMLVLGRSGRGLLRTALFGSTVNSVLDSAEVTVAVVPAMPAA